MIFPLGSWESLVIGDQIFALESFLGYSLENGPDLGTSHGDMEYLTESRDT